MMTAVFYVFLCGATVTLLMIIGGVRTYALGMTVMGLCGLGYCFLGSPSYAIVVYFPLSVALLAIGIIRLGLLCLQRSS